MEGEVDPVRDLDIINEELRLKDEEAFNKVYDELAKKYERGEKKLKLEYVRHMRFIILIMQAALRLTSRFCIFLSQRYS